MKRLKVIAAWMLLLFFVPQYGFAATTATITIMANVLLGESSIAVDLALVNFGTISGSATDRRFTAGPVKISYFAASNPWTIRVYTANPGDVVGLIGVTDTTKSIPLKVWCDNYGPRLNVLGHAPNEENTYYWSGYDFNNDGDKQDVITDGSISEVDLGFDVNGDGDALDTGLGTASIPVTEDPIWLRVPDDGEMVSGQPYTWRRLAYSGADLDSTGFPVFFAIDITGITPQQYRTNNLTFQIIHE